MSLLHDIKKKWTARRAAVFVGPLVFGVFGVVLLLTTQAATNANFIEPEEGVVTGSAVAVNDATASGGQALKLGTVDPQPTGFCSTFPSLPSTKPTAANTGVPSGTSLTTSGSITANSPGMVIDAKNITGEVIVSANNVTIKNSKILVTGYYGIRILDGVTGTKVLNSEIFTSAGGYEGIAGGDVIICGNYIHGFENGMTLGGNSIVQANFIEKLGSTESSPHYDGIEVYSGSNSKFYGNNILMTDKNGQWLGDTGAINVTATWGNINNVELNGNWVGGGSYTLTIDEQNGYNITNLKITNNTWYGTAPKGYALWGPCLLRDPNSLTVDSGNKWENGTALNL